jgi:hypothetical protein
MIVELWIELPPEVRLVQSTILEIRGLLADPEHRRISIDGVELPAELAAGVVIAANPSASGLRGGDA